MPIDYVNFCVNKPERRRSIPNSTPRTMSSYTLILAGSRSTSSASLIFFNEHQLLVRESSPSATGTNVDDVLILLNSGRSQLLVHVVLRANAFEDRDNRLMGY